jgi:hypothetical protein
MSKTYAAPITQEDEQMDNIQINVYAREIAEQIAYKMSAAEYPLISKDMADIESAIYRIINGVIVRRDGKR